MYAPYFAYDILFRGNLAESVAWIFLPLALWTMGRLARTRQKRWFIATTLAYAAVLLTHNVFALIFSPLLGLYGLLEIEWKNNQQSTPNSQQSTKSLTINRLPFTIDHSSLTSFIQITTSLILGLSLTTFFWLPALIERNLVHSDRLLIPPIFVYWGNFITFAEAFTPPQTIYSNLINPSPARTLGLVGLVLALPAILLGWKVFQNGRKHQTIFFTIATAIYVFLMTAVSEPIWANLPLIEFVQFPWRLLGPAALCLAILVGASIDVLTNNQQSTRNSQQSTNSRITHHASRIIIVSIYCTLLILANLYYLDARYCPGLENPTIVDMQAFERASQTIGTTAKGEYLPLTVEYMPTDPAIEPFAPIPDTAVLHSANRTPKQFSATLTATESFTLIANTFDYPGWQATINGEPVAITPSDGTGLITIPIPAGEHDINIQFKETPLRLFANLVSFLSLIALIVIAFIPFKRDQGSGTGDREVTTQSSDLTTQHSITNNQQSTANSQQSTDTSFTIHHSPFTIYHYLILIILGFGLFFLAVYVLPKANSPLQTSALPTTTQTAVYNNGLILLDAQIADSTMPADETLLVTTKWQAPQPVASDFRDTIRLVDSEGKLWSPKTAVSPRWFRSAIDTNLWQPQQFAETQLLIEPIPGTPPGTYIVQLTLFDEETLAPVPLNNGQLALDLGTVQIEAPQTPTELTPQYNLNHVWPDVVLEGASLDRATAAPGDPFHLNLYWQVQNKPEDAFIKLSLVDEADTPVFTQELLPSHSDFPTSAWQAGDKWLGQHPFRLPVNLASGTYQWQLEWCTVTDCAAETAVLGNLTINAPRPHLHRPTTRHRNKCKF